MLMMTLNSLFVADATRGEGPIRVATFNASLYGKQAGQVAERLADGKDQQAQRIAAIVQTVCPDILLISEIDYDADGMTARRLNDNFFAVGSDHAKAIDYPHVLSLPSNTGMASGLDLNRNGQLGEAADAWGFGVYPGQYAFAVFSRYPIDTDGVRTFQRLRWGEVTNPSIPRDPRTGDPYYSDDVWRRLRLSSKNHVDVPIRVTGRSIHLLASHPTPPVFDGPADHNGARNHDEIRFWTNYLSPNRSEALKDDRGRSGGLPSEAAFVIAGDLNADPDHGDGRRGAIRGLLSHPRTIDPRPLRRSSVTGSVSTNKEIDREDQGDPGEAFERPLATADFGRNGQMRVDYVLPGRAFRVSDSGVFWPSPDDPHHDWLRASDHRMVWVDLTWR